MLDVGSIGFNKLTNFAFEVRNTEYKYALAYKISS